MKHFNKAVWDSKDLCKQSKSVIKHIKIIYRFHRNVELKLSVSDWSYQKKFPLPKRRDMSLNSMSQTKGKWHMLILSRPDFWMVWRFPVFLCVDFNIYCSEPTVRKKNWVWTTSATVMVIFKKVPFWKFCHHSYVHSS